MSWMADFLSRFLPHTLRLFTSKTTNSPFFMPMATMSPSGLYAAQRAGWPRFTLFSSFCVNKSKRLRPALGELPAKGKLPNAQDESPWLIKPKLSRVSSKYKSEISHQKSHPTRHMSQSRLQKRDVTQMGVSCVHLVAGSLPSFTPEGTLFVRKGWKISLPFCVKGEFGSFCNCCSVQGFHLICCVKTN